MSLEYLKISNFRNLVTVELAPILSGFNFICGDNGSGKTSLLEAIYYLGLGRSFRTSSATHIVNHRMDTFLLTGQVNYTDNSYPIGMERHREGALKIRIHGKEAKSVAELAQYLPVRLINSSCYLLLEGGPAFRRYYLDWGLFYYADTFFQLWKQFNRALKQRNNLLQARCTKAEIDAWSNELIVYAAGIEMLRREYIKDLLPYLKEMIVKLVPMGPVEINYYQGWDEAQPYELVLALTMGQDMRLGRTQNGPHRADLRLNIQGIPIKDVLSRGQQKLFVCAMIVAQGALLVAQKKRRPIYLVDDLPSELDVASRSKLITLLSEQNAQIFVTAIESDKAQAFAAQPGLATKMFHVKHGQITNMLI